jgi:hypothetical protein
VQPKLSTVIKWYVLGGPAIWGALFVLKATAPSFTTLLLRGDVSPISVFLGSMVTLAWSASMAALTSFYWIIMSITDIRSWTVTVLPTLSGAFLFFLVVRFLIRIVPRVTAQRIYWLSALICVGGITAAAASAPFQAIVRATTPSYSLLATDEFMLITILTGCVLGWLIGMASSK